MKKRIVKLTESDLEKLVQRIIKEEGEEMASSEENTGDENQDNPKDVKEFLMAMKKYFMDKYPRFGKRINTRNEKVLVLAALAQQLGVDPNMIGQAKGKLKDLGL